MEAPKISHLSNGMIVVTQRIPSEQSHVALDVSVGALHEKANELGIAHFIEHMALKKTKNWDIDKQAEKVRDAAGYSNAYTSIANTQYFYHVNNRNVPDMIRMLADSMLRPEFSQDSINNEAKTIINEMIYRGSQANSYSIFGDLTGRIMFPEDSRFGADIVGNEKSLKSFTVDDLKKFMAKHYTANRMALVVTGGDVNHEEICRIAEKEFKGLPMGKPEDAKAPAIMPRRGYAVLDDPNAYQIIFGMSFPLKGTDAGIREGYKNALLSVMLSGDLARPLYKNLRTQNGLVYVTEAAVEEFSNFGALTLQASFLPQNSQGIAKGMAEEVKNLADHITEKDMEQARKVLMGETIRLSENTTNAGLLLAKQLRDYGKVMSLEEKEQILKSITVDELKEHARQVFSQAPTVVVYGKDARKFPSYDQITTMLGLPPQRLAKNGLLMEPKSDKSWAEKTGAAAEKASFEQRVENSKAASGQQQSSI